MTSTYNIQKANPAITLHRIGTKQQGIKLLKGYDELRFVSYVTSLKEILKLRENLSIEKITGIIGFKVIDHFKEELRKDKQDVASLLEMVQKGELLLYYPDKGKELHDKYYHLRSPSQERVIIGSANLTKNGLFNSKQHNIVLTFDTEAGAVESNSHDASPASFDHYFQGLKRECSLFMQDLVDLVEAKPAEDQEEVIDQWLAGHAVNADEQEARSFVTDITEQAFENRIAEENTTFEVALPSNQKAKKHVEKLIPASTTANGKMLIDSSHVLYEVKKQIGLPLMNISKNDNTWQVYCQNEQLHCRTKQPESRQEVNRCLQLIEDYCNTVDSGETNHPTKVKTTIFETMLYFLASPFMHQWMKEKERQIGQVHDRGPRYLLIYGDSSNGKSTFVKYMLQILCGQKVGPLQPKQLTNTKLRDLGSYNTLFPAVFDDVDMKKVHDCEQTFKTYWERIWDGKTNTPQIILTSNRRDFKDWFETRALICDFDVKFAQDMNQMKKLNDIIAQDNDLFCYFSYFYLNRNESSNHVSSDELFKARTVMQELYEYAGRTIPSFFPSRPLEQLFDKDHDKWLELIYKKKKAHILKNRDHFKVKFDQDMKYSTVKWYCQSLPSTLNLEQDGNMITINNKKGFEDWFYREAQNRGFFHNLRQKLRL